MINKNPKYDLDINNIYINDLFRVINYGDTYHLTVTNDDKYFIKKKENDTIICRINIFNKKNENYIAHSLSELISVTDINNNIIGYMVKIGKNIVNSTTNDTELTSINDFLFDFQKQYNGFNISKNILLFSSKRVFLCRSNNDITKNVEFEFIEGVSGKITDNTKEKFNDILNDFFTYQPTQDEIIENFQYQLHRNSSFFDKYIKDDYPNFDNNLTLSENIIIDFHNWTKEAIIKHEKNSVLLSNYISKLAETIFHMEEEKENSELYDKYEEIAKEIKSFYFNFTEPPSNIAKTKRNLLTFSVLSIIFIMLGIMPKPVQEKGIEGLQSPFFSGLYMNISSQLYLFISYSVIIVIILYLMYSLNLLKNSFMSNYEQHKFELKDKITNFVTLYYKILPEYKTQDIYKYFTDFTTQHFIEDTKKIIHNKELVDTISSKLAYIDDKNTKHRCIIKCSKFFMKLIQFTKILNINYETTISNKLNWNLNDDFIQKYNNTRKKGNMLLECANSPSDITISDFFGKNFGDIKKTIKSNQDFFEKNTYLFYKDLLYANLPMLKNITNSNQPFFELFDVKFEQNDILEIKDLDIESADYDYIIKNLNSLLHYKKLYKLEPDTFKIKRASVRSILENNKREFDNKPDTKNNPISTQDDSIIDIIYNDRIKFYEEQEKTFLLLDIKMPIRLGILSLVIMLFASLYHIFCATDSNIVNTVNITIIHVNNAIM